MTYTIAYVIGWAVASTVVGTHIIRERVSWNPNPDVAERAMAALLACIIGLFWPLALPIAIIWRSSSWWASILDRADKAAEDRELDRRERAACLAQLELELGIREDQ